MKKILLTFVIFITLFLTACTDDDTTTLTTIASTTEETTTTQSLANYISDLSNPYNIALFVTEDLTTSIGINFELSIDTIGYVEYAELGDTEYSRVEATNKYMFFSDKEVFLYEATLDDLTPGTTYEYRIVDEGELNIGDYHTFTTQTNNKEAYSLMYLADPQENAETGYMAYAYAIYNVSQFSEINYELVMSPGDLVNDHDIRSQWNMFFEYSSMFSFNIPFAAALGNHELPDISTDEVNVMGFDAYQNLPNNGPMYNVFDVLEEDNRSIDFDIGKTYSFDYGFAHIVVIDTEIYCDGTTVCSNYDTANAGLLNTWVRNDINNSDAEWQIVMLHRGPYSMSYDTNNVRNSLVPVLEECGVDLVLAGHDHQYSRAIYYDENIVDFATANEYGYGELNLVEDSSDNYNFNYYSRTLGITYLTSNTTATKFYGGDKSSGIEVNYVFQDEYPVIPMITITEDEIQVISYAVEKDTGLSIVPTGVFILEQFTITK